MGRAAKGCLIGCGVTLLLCVIAVLAGVSWFRGTYLRPAPPAPKLAAGTAMRPLFVRSTGQRYQAGTAVAVRLQPGGKPVLLTALHLFGPNGGSFQAETPPAELRTKIRGVLLFPFSGKAPLGAATGALRTTGPALREADPGVENDVAAFALVPKSRCPVLDLAPGNPGLGEWVWLVGDIYNHRPQMQRLFPGQVMTANDGGAAVRFKQSFELRAFSGAPAVNARKQVVGLLISGRPGLGTLIPAGAIRKRLAESGVK